MNTSNIDYQELRRLLLCDAAFTIEKLVKLCDEGKEVSTLALLEAMKQLTIYIAFVTEEDYAGHLLSKIKEASNGKEENKEGEEDNQA